mgnify:CR=1 FL=1
MVATRPLRPQMPVNNISHGSATGVDDLSGFGGDGLPSGAVSVPHSPKAKQLTATTEKVKLHEQFQALLQGKKRKSQEMSVVKQVSSPASPLSSTDSSICVPHLQWSSRRGNLHSIGENQIVVKCNLHAGACGFTMTYTDASEFETFEILAAQWLDEHAELFEHGDLEQAN